MTNLPCSYYFYYSYFCLCTPFSIFAIYPKIRTIVTQNLRFENTKPGQEQAIPFDGLCSPASSAYG